MPKKEYEWEDGNIPLIGEHSLAKHKILREYVETYIEVLTRNPRIERLRLALVDGFAGGGIYQLEGSRAPHLGSPAILVQASSAAIARVNESRRRPLELERSFFFVEKNRHNFEALKHTLATHVAPEHPAITPTILPGRFEDQLESIIAQIKSTGRTHRAIFLLDQYGYNAVPLPMLKRIFEALPRAEVFMTLAVGIRG